MDIPASAAAFASCSSFDNSTSSSFFFFLPNNPRVNKVPAITGICTGFAGASVFLISAETSFFGVFIAEAAYNPPAATVANTAFLVNLFIFISHHTFLSR